MLETAELCSLRSHTAVPNVQYIPVSPCISMYLLLIALSVGLVAGDTPANCSYEDVEGSWIFYESERSGDSSIDCSAMAAVNKVRMVLKYPDTAVDEFGNIGKWTMVYNQVRDHTARWILLF